MRTERSAHIPNVLRLAGFRPDSEIAHLWPRHGLTHLLSHWEIGSVLGGLHQSLLRAALGWHRKG